MADRRYREVKLEGEASERARSLNADATKALRALDEFVAAQLEGDGAPKGRSEFAVIAFADDPGFITDGETYCGVYDEAAGVCRDCTPEEWKRALDIHEEQFRGP